MRIAQRAWRATVLLLTIPGCTTYGPVDAQTYIIARRPLDVWVTRTDSSVVHFHRPKMRGDTVGGWIDNEFVTIPPDQIAQVRAHRAAPKRTALLIGGCIVVIGTAALLVNGSVTEAPVADTGEARIALP